MSDTEHTSHMSSAGTLDEKTVHRSPIEQFKLWYREAVEAGEPEPDAMALATSTAGGFPSARTVLLKRVDSRGLVFFTNYLSRKGQELEENPRAALLFYWPILARQVRAEGIVAKIRGGESDEYFRSRPRGSQISASISPQSNEVQGRDELERLALEYASRHAGSSLPRPPHWGGYRLAPNVIEFWQGRDNRLHDRILYKLRDDETWIIKRLAP